MTSNISTRIHAENLSKHYGETVVLDDVSLRIDEGESIAIMGPSGSSKTTLLHILAGTYPSRYGKGDAAD